MSVTAAEVVSLIRGEGSEELRLRFLAESGDPGSELSRMLEASAARARVHLNDRSPSPRAQTPLPPPAVKVLRQAAMWEEDGSATGEPSLQELVACIQGTATPSIMAAVERALSNPDSNLSRAVRRDDTKTA